MINYTKENQALKYFNVSGSSVNNSEGALIKQLFKDYDTDVKPTLTPNEVINITIQFYINRLQSLVSVNTSTHYDFMGIFLSITRF